MYKHRFVTLIAILTLLFIFLPLVLIIVTSFNSANTILSSVQGFSLQWFIKVFKSRALVQSFKNSFLLAFTASLVGIVIGFGCFSGFGEKTRPLEQSIAFPVPLPLIDTRHRLSGTFCSCSLS